MKIHILGYVLKCLEEYVFGVTNTINEQSILYIQYYDQF